MALRRTRGADPGSGRRPVTDRAPPGHGSDGPAGLATHGIGRGTLCFTAVTIPTEPPPSPTSGRRALGCLVEIVETVILTAILFWVIQNFVAQPFQVQQVSMRDTIQDGQYVLVDRLTPRFDGYHRGDIIVFTPPDNAESPGGKPFIKRVIGVGGDVVELRDGKVFVNGTELDEASYVYTVDGEAQATVPLNGQSQWTIAPGELFVMGDHRGASSDSRVFGPIQVSSVIGRAWIRYWPLQDFEVLPTAGHPELQSPAPGASIAPSAKPSASPTKRPAASPTKRPAKSPKP
jgi:signal peptidase I